MMFKVGDKVLCGRDRVEGKIRAISADRWVEIFYEDGKTGIFWVDDVLPVDNKPLSGWDEQTRGKRMSNNTGKVIFKYQMPLQEKFEMKLPAGAEILRVDFQVGMLWLWAVVDTRNEPETRKFYAVKCGGNVPENKNLKYLGFCPVFVQQEIALYIFEDLTDG